jgi:hypothetical protein
MGLPPANYSKDSLLAEPIQKKTVLPVQGGGAVETVYKGLVNTGIDCYINSAIQFLYSVVPFRELILKSTADTLNPIAAADKDTEAETIRKRDGILALKHVFEEYEKVDKIDIRKLPGPLDAFKPILRLGGVNDKGEPLMDQSRQQDSHELIGHIFNALHKFIIPKELESFEHVYMRTVLCKDNNTRDLDEPRSSSIIILPMKGKSVQEIFTNAQNARELDDKNNKIPVCKSATDTEGIGISMKDTYDVSKTEYLTFLLQRYSADGKKIKDSIKINKIIKIGERNYEILGSILHMGGTGSGHYMYNVYDEGSLAITLNDEAKTESTAKSVGPFVEGDVSTLGYIFLYKHTDKEPGAETESEPEAEEPTIKLAVGFRVRNPEAAKDKIKELSFTHGEELLFKRLGFDKPFIRKYITLPDASKEKSNASKDAFFKFWKTYVLMDGTSQFSLMTKGESQKVQQYMRDILDAYRKYLSESALQLLFHTSGKPYEPISEGESADSFVFTKVSTTNYKKISAAVKILIESIASAKEININSHRINIANSADNKIRIKAAYENLRKDVMQLIVEAKKAIAAAKDAALNTGEAVTKLTALEAFKFTPGDDPEDFIKAGNESISLANKLIKNLEDLEKAAREFAVIVELEGEDESNNSSNESYENGSEEDEDEEEDDEDTEDEDEDEDEEEDNVDSNSGTAGSLENVRRPKVLELIKILSSIDKIVSKRLDDNKTISDIIVTLSNALSEDDFGAKLRIFMGNPRKTEGIHIDVGSSKIAPSTFFNLYLIDKGKSLLDPNKRFTAIIHNLIKLDLRRLNYSVKGELVQIFEKKILLRDITKHRNRLLQFMDKRVI